MILTPYLAQKIEECRQSYGLGSTVHDLVEILHDQGLSVKDASIVISGVLNIEPKEAHFLVADNPIWIEIVDPSSPIFNEVMHILDKDGEVDDMGDGVVVFREPLSFTPSSGPSA